MPSIHQISTILSDRHFNSLKVILNAERDKVRFAAYALRLKYMKQFKNIAKTKASKKGLHINVEKAKKCPQTAVSVIPLPIIEPSDTPNPSPAQLPSRRRRPSSMTSPTSLLLGRKSQSRPRPVSSPPGNLVSSDLSPLSSSLQMCSLPDVHRQASFVPHAPQVLPRLDMPPIPTISVSYPSAVSIEDRVPKDVLGAIDDDLYAPPAPASLIRELPEVPLDAVCWFDGELSSNSSPSSSRSSSSGPDTPDGSEALSIRIRKRKLFDEEDQHPKHIMKKRWSASSNVCNASYWRSGIYFPE